jgi:hypothetical protein
VANGTPGDSPLPVDVHLVNPALGIPTEDRVFGYRFIADEVGVYGLPALT